MEQANALPRKRFFREMFTRDLSLEDCILDLIDNSIDGAIRSRHLDIAAAILKPNGQAKGENVPAVEVTYSANEFRIKDRCGGIPLPLARTEVFTFGHGSDYQAQELGVYGIGLKRAIFKIGNHFFMKSQTRKDGFEVTLDVDKWVEKDDTLDDWQVPLETIDGTDSLEKAGTEILIQKLREETEMRLEDGTLENNLHSRISQTYAYILNRFVTVTLNRKKIPPKSIPIGSSNNIPVAHDRFEERGVKVQLFAGLAARSSAGEWPVEQAGWYVFCNGRAVTFADKTELTGWGSGALPSFHSKYRGLVGLAFFQADDPALLPWTTTKRGLNRESIIYQKARNRMRTISRPVITFLDKMYPSETPEQSTERAMAEEVKTIEIVQVAKKPVGSFEVRRQEKSKPKTTVRIQYDAEREDVVRIAKHLRHPSMTANRVGKYTFDWYLKTECAK